jgi:hypothetical protein
VIGTLALPHKTAAELDQPSKISYGMITLNTT